MYEQFRKLKRLTGCTYEKIGKMNHYTRQNIHLMLVAPTRNSNKRMAEMMKVYIDTVISQELKAFNARMNELNQLKREIDEAKHLIADESA